MSKPQGKAPPAIPAKAAGRRLARYMLRYKAQFGVAVLGMFVVAGTTAITAFLLEPVVNGLASDARGILLPVAGAIVLFQCAKAIGMFTQNFLMTAIAQHIVTDIQRELVRSIYTADLKRLQAAHSGEFMATTMSNVGLIGQATTKSVTAVIRDLATVLGLVAVMFYQDAVLASIALIIVPILVLNVRQQSKVTGKATKKTMKETGTLTMLLAETLDGVRTVRSYGQEEREIARTNATIDRRLQHQVTAAGARSLTVPISEAASGVGMAAIILYAWATPNLDLGEFASFIGATILCYQPMRAVAQAIPLINVGLTAAAKVFEELDKAPEIRDRPGAKPLEISGGRVTFERVTFAYGDEIPALDDLSLDVAPRQTVALVGPSGAGKTTIFSLLQRFYDIDGGAIRIDGQEIRDVTQASLRHAIGLVTQEPFLFDDTVHANIAYGRPGASRAEVERAARAAGAHEFISALPRGYDTRVGEAGMMLSGGQRQRIAIARAMLKDAPILLLDEATSALDTRSERQVQDALRTLMVDRTVIVIAHRLSTILDADRIFVLDRGRVAESGTHLELLAKGGLYAQLYRTQFSGEAKSDADTAPIPFAQAH